MECPRPSLPLATDGEREGPSQHVRAPRCLLLSPPLCCNHSLPASVYLTQRESPGL